MRWSKDLITLSVKFLTMLLKNVYHRFPHRKLMTSSYVFFFSTKRAKIYNLYKYCKSPYCSTFCPFSCFSNVYKIFISRFNSWQSVCDPWEIYCTQTSTCFHVRLNLAKYLKLDFPFSQPITPDLTRTWGLRLDRLKKYLLSLLHFLDEGRGCNDTLSDILGYFIKDCWFVCTTFYCWVELVAMWVLTKW